LPAIIVTNRSVPRLLFLDSGLGGLTVLRAARAAIPEAEVLFIADDAGFPYGTQDEIALAARLEKLVQKSAADFAPDCVVLACNTASTVALAMLRKTCPVPIVGTVPAVKPAAALTKTGLVSVLATPGTARREYTRALIEQFGGGVRFNLVGAPHLAAMAEAYAGGGAVDDESIRSEIAPCFLEENGARTDVVVLGCTHYPLLLGRLEALAPWPVTWLDAAPAIARRIANILAHDGHVVGVGTKRHPGHIQFTSGRVPSVHLLSLLKEHHLEVSPFGAALVA
jgi:glutamate racemase